MDANAFIDRLDDAKIVAAIAEAEARTSGEIRVFVSEHHIAEPEILAEAKVQFTRMGMEKTAERNGVLIFIAPQSRAFAVLGDAAVHAKCGETFWSATAEKMRAQFKNGNFADGLVEGIRSVGDVLAREFPRRGDDRNELPDSVERG